MSSRSRTSWSRLFCLLDLIEDMNDAGHVPAEEARRLRLVVAGIIHADGGIDMKDQVPDFDDPAGGGLAEHAFAVLSRELIPQDPCWEPTIKDIQDQYPHQPARPR